MIYRNKTNGRFEKKMRKFEEVREECKKYAGETILPSRATKKSAGYDFYAKVSVSANPGEIVKIWSDVKALMNEDEVLMLYVRSSMGGKWMLSNSTGVIDSDYYSNPKNDGNIGLFLKNISNEVQKIEKGDRIAQGIFIKYLVTDNDAAEGNRIGGHGSTGK